MFVIHANLDAEARWVGSALPGAIATRVSYYAALLSIFAPDDNVEVWAPAVIDASRLIASPAWRPPTMRVGAPPRADLVWARPDAKAANDRRLALAIAHELDVALPGAVVIESVDALVVWTTRRGRWVAKAPWTTAGRDRCHGDGAPTDEQRTRLSRLLEKFGALVVEPWVDRMFDVGLCARVDEFRPRTTGDALMTPSDARPRDVTRDARPRDAPPRDARPGDAPPRDATSRDGSRDATPPEVSPRDTAMRDPPRDTSPSDTETPDFYVTLSDPHSLITDARGTFLGIDLAAPPLLPHEATQLGVTARTVGAKLAALGFRGAFAIDAFVYRDANGERRFHPLCEINARTTFGHVARAFEARGFTRLGFGTPPVGATLLVAPANDGVTAWIA